MRIKFWGVRGSIPSPIGTDGLDEKLFEALKFARIVWETQPEKSVEEVFSELPLSIRRVIGGETTCVELELDGHTLIFDMGSGARKLGYNLAGRMKNGGDLHILQTHTHWDHIQGWPFFVPGYLPDFHIHFHSAISDIEERYVTQQRFKYFPKAFHEMASKKSFNIFQPGKSFKIGPFEVETIQLIHPGDSTSYKIESSDHKFVFSTDTEFFEPDLKVKVNTYRSFFENADILAIDAQYSLEESKQRVGWGHTAMVVAIDCAVEWNVKHLILTHHEPAHSDSKTWALFDEAMNHFEKVHGGKGLKIELALEGAEYFL